MSILWYENKGSEIIKLEQNRQTFFFFSSFPINAQRFVRKNKRESLPVIKGDRSKIKKSFYVDITRQKEIDLMFHSAIKGINIDDWSDHTRPQKFMRNIKTNNFFFQVTTEWNSWINITIYQTKFLNPPPPSALNSV